MRRPRTIVALGTAVLVGGVLVSLNVSAQEKKESARVARVKDIMRGNHKVHCGPIGKALKGDLDDEGWEKVITHAAMMNESGHVLMQNNRCPDGTWAKACATLRDGSAGVVQAANAKDKGAANSAFQAMTGACKACHKAHKKK